MTELFVKCVFGKRPHSKSGDSRSDDGTSVQPPTTGQHNHIAVAEPVRIIHKDQDQISAFCLNQVCIIKSFLKHMHILAGYTSTFYIQYVPIFILQIAIMIISSILSSDSF